MLEVLLSLELILAHHHPHATCESLSLEMVKFHVEDSSESKARGECTEILL